MVFHWQHSLSAAENHQTITALCIEQLHSPFLRLQQEPFHISNIILILTEINTGSQNLEKNHAVFFLLIFQIFCKKKIFCTQIFFQDSYSHAFCILVSFKSVLIPYREEEEEEDGEEEIRQPHLRFWTIILALSNSWMNPVLYAIFNNHFRREMVTIVTLRLVITIVTLGYWWPRCSLQYLILSG